jgi:hypothetical protein
MARNFYRAVWDNSEEGWYFEVSVNGHLESGCKPGEVFDDPDEKQKELRAAALRYAKWCGMDVKNLEFSILK